MNRERWKSIGSHAVGLWETARRGATYNPLSPASSKTRTRPMHGSADEAPCTEARFLGSWVLTRYENVLAAAKDHERFSNDTRWRGTTTSVLPPAPDDYSILRRPSEHMRLRKVAVKAFTKARLEALGETITHTAAELIERTARRGRSTGSPRLPSPLPCA